ncbi:MAG TPA: hypothetical protein VGM18_19575 [Candidatus Sulfotelmatobacter sp.]|jgi:hypothetical protein
MRILSSIFVAMLVSAIALGQSQGDGSAAAAVSSATLPAIAGPSSSSASFASASSSSASTSAAPAAAYGYIPFAGSSQGAEADVDSSNPNTPWLPVLINGETPSAAFAGELERNNQISGGMTVASGYDENALTQNGGQVDNASVSFLPSLSWEQSRPHGLFDLSYSPGFTVNQALPELNSSTQNAGMNSQLRLTENLTWRIRDAFVATNNGWTNTTADAPGSVLHEPSQPVLMPLARTVSNLAASDLIYQIGAGTIVGGTGSYSLLSYGNLQSGPGAELGVNLIDSRTTGAEIFYQHRILPKHWIGLTYSFQRLSFDGGLEETQSHSALLFDTITIQSHLTLSLFGGATHSLTNGQVALVTSGTTATAGSAQWSPSAGVMLGWEGTHTAVSATFSRRVESGGGILGTVDRYSGIATVRRQFSPNWTGAINFIYDSNRPLDGAEGEYRTLSGSASAERRIGRQMAAAASYTRVHQTYGVVIPTQLFPDHNRAMVSVSYFFSRPLGR